MRCLESGYAANVEAVVTARPEALPIDGLPEAVVYDTGDTPTIATLVDWANKADLGRTITAVRPSYDEWLHDLDEIGLPPHVQQHISTMARLHGEDRYNRSTRTVEDITGHPAQTVRQYVEEHRDLFS